MKPEHDLRDALRQRFSDTPAMPDEVLREVLERVPETPQQRRRRWWPFRRHTTPTPTLPTRGLQPRPDAAMVSQVPPSSGGTPAVSGIARFAAAAVIVAAFGGFLLFGVLAPPSQDTQPGAVTSPSTSPTPTPVDASTAPTAEPTEVPMQLRTPAATAAATAAALMITTGLAAQEPSFVAEQVEPGVERIVSDGADFDMATLDDGVLYAFDDIATGPDGEVWVVAHRYHTATGRTEGPLVWELGTPGDYGPDAGFPAEHTKLIVDVDGTPIVAAPGGIKAFDGSAWVDSTGSRIIETGGGAVILIEPADLAAAAGSLPSGASDGVLAVGSDLVGYTLDEELGRRFMREWPSWWESCSDTGVEYRNGTGCIDRSAEDERGVGVGHDDEGRALFLADETTGRIARSPEGAIWVLAGPTLDDLWSRRSTESGAIYRIDPQAPGHRCEGC